MIISVLFVFLFAACAWASIYARGPWQAKLALMLSIPLAAFFVHQSLDSYKGYSAEVGLPDDSQFVACIVEEPDAKTHFNGRIYLWLIPAASSRGRLEYKPTTTEPRSYSKPYSRGLHIACDTAQRAVAKGIRVGLAKAAGRGHDRYRRGLYHPYRLPPMHTHQKGTR